MFRLTIFAIVSAATLAARAEPPADGEINRFKDERAMFCVAFSPDSKLLVAGGNGKVARLWDVESGKLLRTFEGHQTPVWCVAFSADGKYLLTGSGGHDPDAIPPAGIPGPPFDNIVRMFEVESGKEIQQFKGHTDRVLAAKYSKNGDRIMTGSADRTIRIWETKSGKELSKFVVEKVHQVEAIAFSSDGRKALSAHAARVVSLWDVESGKRLQQFENGRGVVWRLAFSPDGKQALSGGGYHNNPKDGKVTYHDTTARLWDLDAGKLIRKFEGHETNVLALAFSPDGSRVISGSGGIYFPRPMGAIKEVTTDNSIRIWDTASGKELRKLNGHSDIVFAIAVAPNGKSFASTSDDKTVRIWEMPK